MKRILFTILLLVSCVTISRAQLIQSNFTGVLTPQYICSGGTTRLPYLYRATVSGLLANTKYRYYSNACRYTDFGGTNSGAGNPIFVNGTNFRYSTSTSLSNPAGYDSLTTDGSGSYTGWFGFVNTGNARFTAGNYVYPTITLDSAGNGSTKYRFALNDSMLVLEFSTSSAATSGTGLYGISQATPKNVSLLYDNIAGTGRPLSMIYVESVGIDTTTMASLVQYYKDSVDLKNGRFGVVIPNVLPNGVRRINIVRLSDGTLASFQTDSDGIWPSGTNTVNPAGGSANPIRLNQQDIILTIKNENIIPDNFSLEQNYPNPFNPSTTIGFSIPADGNVEIKLFDLLGKEVSVLANEVFGKGTYSVNFNAGLLQSGVYFYSMNFSGKNGMFFSDRKKLVLIK